MQFPELESKVVLITGAGKGMGKAIAWAFSEQNSIVVITDINEKEAAKVSEKLTKKGRQASFAHMDVTNRPEAEKVVKEVEDEWGRIDILVNNAGVSTMSLVVDLTDEDWDYNMNINAKGVFIISQLIVRKMIEKNIKGKIINIVSMAGKKADPFFAHYSASKFAVIGFTQGLALEVAKYGINVNAVCPGYVKTSMQEREIQWEAKLRGIAPEEVIQLYLKNIPLGRIGEPKDVAKVVIFLASNLSDYMSGQAINITGGACMY